MQKEEKSDQDTKIQTAYEGSLVTILVLHEVHMKCSWVAKRGKNRKRLSLSGREQKKLNKKSKKQKETQSL